MKEKKRNLLWAQTMPDALFGPFLSSSPSLPFKIPIIPTYGSKLTMWMELRTNKEQSNIMSTSIWKKMEGR